MQDKSKNNPPKRPKVKDLYDLETRLRMQEIRVKMDVIAGIKKIPKEKFPKSAISVEEIEKICMQSFNIERNQLIGKFRHNDEFNCRLKRFFLAACYFYTDNSVQYMADYMGINAKWTVRSLWDIIYSLKYERVRTFGPLNTLFLALDKILPGRLDDIIHEEGFTVEGSKRPAESKKINEIEQLPIHNSLWTNDANYSKKLLFYDLRDPNLCLTIDDRCDNRSLLFLLQEDGVRIIDNYSEPAPKMPTFNKPSGRSDVSMADIILKLSEQNTALLKEIARLKDELRDEGESWKNEELDINSHFRKLSSYSNKEIKKLCCDFSIEQLESELNIWIEKEEYRVCQVIKELIDEKLNLK